MLLQSVQFLPLKVLNSVVISRYTLGREHADVANVTSVFALYVDSHQNVITQLFYVLHPSLE